MADDNAELALRRLQMIDQAVSLEPEVRLWLTEAEDALGRLLGLECRGVDEGGGFYNHDNGTCPIHEWLDENDYAAANAALERRTA